MKTKLIFWLKIVSCIQNALQYVFVYFNMDELMKIYIYRKKSVLIHTTSLGTEKEKGMTANHECFMDFYSRYKQLL